MLTWLMRTQNLPTDRVPISRRSLLTCPSSAGQPTSRCTTMAHMKMALPVTAGMEREHFQYQLTSEQETTQPKLLSRTEPER